MATDDSTTPAAPAALPEHSDLLDALLNLKGAIRLSREAVYNQMNGNDGLVAAEGVLQLAENEMERIYAMVDCSRIASAWPTAAEEVAHV